MRRKNNLFMSLIILVMASLVACSNPTITVSPSSSASTPSSSASASVVKLSGNISALIWLPDAPQLIQEWVKGYNAVNPDVKVDVQMMVGQGLAENIQPRIAANTLPDLFSTNVSELCSSIADKAMLADLGDTKSWNEQLDGIKTAWTSPKGVKFGISCGVASSLIYYNQDLFTKAGITTLPANWDEFLAACEKLKTAGITPFAWFGGYPNLLTHGPLSWGMAQEIISVIPNFPAMSKTDKYNYAGWDKIYDKMVLLGTKGYFQKNFLGTDMNQGQQIFLAGEAAMIFHGTWVSGMFLDAKGLNVSCMIPPWNAAGKDVVAVLGSEAGFSIAKNANSALAKSLLDYMMYEHFEVWQHARKGIPPFKPNAKYIVNQKITDYVNKLSQCKSAVGLASHVMPPPVFTEAMKLCQEMYTGKKPSEVPAILAKLQVDYIDQKAK